jgi:hypothetical protein
MKHVSGAVPSSEQISMEFDAEDVYLVNVFRLIWWKLKSNTIFLKK